jgi:ribosomal-protein-serine acetyltransferase
MQPITVDSEIELRMLAPADAQALFAVTDANRAHLRQWLPWLDNVRVVEDTEGFISKCALLQQESNAYTAGIWWRRELVGVIGHNRIDWDNRITHPGYWLSAHAQNRGIMIRSVSALVQHAFDVLDLNRVEICTAVGNHRSTAIPTRLGFAHEGIRRQGEWLYDRFVDLNVFAMVRYVWPSRSR